MRRLLGDEGRLENAAVLTEQELLKRVVQLVEVGHHLDQVPGLPGTGMDDPGVLPGYRRLFQRGTAEFAAAAADGLLDRLPPLTAATPTG